MLEFSENVKKCLGHVHAFNKLIICIKKKANKKKGTKCPKVSSEGNAYVLYLKLECMNMWKTWLMDG